MKHTIHTPTEQFGFVETEFGENDFSDAPTVMNLIAAHKDIVETVKPKEGMPSDEFNGILDEYLTTDKIDGDPGMTEKMSVAQLAIIQAIKRSRKRTNQ